MTYELEAELATKEVAVLRELVRAIKLGKRPPDFMFDRFLPLELRLVSGQHWTPVEVALRAAEWLMEFRVTSVLDIGSGSGKFCVVAALATEAFFIGLEQRPRLVRAACDLARLFGVGERVEFVQGDFNDACAPTAEAYYLFNPFGENLYGSQGQMDDQVELGARRYRRDVAAVERLLRAARAGTFVLTYNGFGGDIPADYQMVRVDRELPNVLTLWRKRSKLPKAANHGDVSSACA